MPKFIPYDYAQSAMVVINYEERLQPGTFEHALHYLINNKLNGVVASVDYAAIDFPSLTV